MDFKLINTDSKNDDFIKLANFLDQDLNERYGELQKQYDKHNKPDYIKNVVLVYIDTLPMACGAYKEYDQASAEIKRVFVRKDFRKQGIARLIICTLEDQLQKVGYKYSVLETGIKQVEAIGLYKSLGYEFIENYGPYAGNSNSVCMRKSL